MFVLFCACLLGHDEYRVREVSLIVVKQYGTNELWKDLLSSESAEVRFHSDQVLKSRRLGRIWSESGNSYVDHPERFYQLWIDHDFAFQGVSDEQLIRDVQSSPRRQAIISKYGSIHSWCHPHYCMQDHTTLERWKKEVKNVPPR
jgi:hypothetical protein